MLIAPMRRFLDEHQIGPCRILTAVSGGPDSVALLLASSELRTGGFDVVCGHVNHRLRGAESDEDEAYVRALSASLDVPLLVADGTLPGELVRQHGIEAAAREVRTARLLDMRQKSGARFVATAHQKNDQAETVLMRLFTGAGLAGLRGIHPVRDDGFIRPLLEVTRREIDEFLRERGITPRVDRMNSDPRFLRTRIRTLLRDFDPSIVENLAAVARQARSRFQAFEEHLATIEHVETTAEETRFLSMPDDPAMRQALLYRHIRRLGGGREVSSADLARLAAGLETLKRVSVTRSLELVRKRGTILLRRRPAIAAEYALSVGAGDEVRLPDSGRILRVRRAGANARPAGQRGLDWVQPFQLPCGAAASFEVRNRRRGDRFHPLGSSGEKKLKAFLIDRKIPVEERDSLPLLLWKGEIVWVGGVEVSDRFKLTGDGGGDRYVVEVDCTETARTIAGTE